MIIYVKDFVKPSENTDCAKGIRAAIAKALEISATKIVFEEGIYYLKSTVKVITDVMLHDAGSPVDQAYKDAHIHIDRMNDITFLGAKDDLGNPTTIFTGYNDLENHSFLPSILWASDCNNIAFENIKFKRTPEYSSAGRVVSRGQRYVDVEVFSGNPIRDNMGAHCMNAFFPNVKKLKGESVTYGPGASEPFKQIDEKTLRLNDWSVASKVSIGDIVSWHQGGQTDFQVYFCMCENLKLQNIHTANSNGFAMISDRCKNIYANKVEFKPEGNLYFTAPRDAWKLLQCSGDIIIDTMYIEGVRMDGQNMHSNFIILEEILSPKKAVFFCRYAKREFSGLVEFYTDSDILGVELLEYEFIKEGTGGNYYELTFSENMPKFAQKGTLCTLKDWEPTTYTLTNSEFFNIAGAGNLVRNDHLTIENCKYSNIMNSGILLGTELYTHYEGGHATNIKIKKCEFDNCGFFPRYGTVGAIGVHSFGFHSPTNKDILIEDCTFKNMNTGIHLITAKDVVIKNATFENVIEEVRIDEGTTESITIL